MPFHPFYASLISGASRSVSLSQDVLHAVARKRLVIVRDEGWRYGRGVTGRGSVRENKKERETDTVEIELVLGKSENEV